MTRSRNVADVQANGVSAVPNAVAGKNAVINGGFDMWQRGTSGTIAAGSYVAADRYYTYRNTTGSTFSRQASGLTGFQYSGRIARDSGNTATANISVGQIIESINSIPFAGQTVTLSFYAKAGANYSASSNILRARLLSSTITDTNIVLNGGTTVVDQNATLTTSWQRFTYSGTVGSTAVTLGFIFSYDPVGTAGAADNYEITGVQLEVGSQATPFSRAGGTIQGELGACQRYYNRVGSVNGGTFTYMANGVFSSSTEFRFAYNYPVQMRVAPTSVDYSGNFYAQDFVTGYGGTVVTIQANGAGISSAGLNLAVTGATAGRPGLLFSNSASNVYFGLSAEL